MTTLKLKLMAMRFLQHPVVLMDKTKSRLVHQSMIYPQPVRYKERTNVKERMFQDILMRLISYNESAIIALPNRIARVYAGADLLSLMKCHKSFKTSEIFAIGNHVPGL